MMAKNIKDDPGDNFDNMDIPAVNFFVTQPALHYALSWWKFWCLKDLCTISQTTTNYQPIKATRAPECRHMSCLGLQGVVEHPINRSFNQSNNQEIKQPTNQTTNKSANPIYLNTDIWTGQVCREGLDKTMAHRSRRCSRLTHHSTWVSIIIMRTW